MDYVNQQDNKQILRQIVLPTQFSLEEYAYVIQDLLKQMDHVLKM